MGNQWGRAVVCDIHGFGRDRRRPPETIHIVFILPRELKEVRCRVTAVEIRLAIDFVKAYNAEHPESPPVRLFEIEPPPGLEELRREVQFLAFSTLESPRGGSRGRSFDDLDALAATPGCDSAMIQALDRASDEVRRGEGHPQRAPEAFTSSASESIGYMSQQCALRYPAYCARLRGNLLEEMKRRILDFHQERRFVSYVMLGPSEFLFPFADAWRSDAETEDYRTDGPRFVASMTKDWSPAVNQTILRDWACSFLRFRRSYAIETLSARRE